MKFSCIKENLEQAVTLAEKFAGKNMTLPVLGSILFETHLNQLHVVATNLEYAVQILVQGKVIREGRISVPAKTVSSLIQSVKEDKIELEEKHNNLVVKTNTRDIKINGTSSEDFPLLPEIKKITSFTVEMEILKHGLDKVLPSVALSDFKPEFSGVFFKVTPSELKVVATDTFRLAEYKIDFSSKKEKQNISFILPHQVAQEISRINSLDKDMVISLGDNQVLFETDGIKIISRVIDGNFPEYGSIIPTTFESSALVNRGELKDSVRASGIFSSKLMDVFLEFGNSEVEVYSANQDVGEYRNKIPLKTVDNKGSTRVSFNHRYLLDGLNSLEEEDVFIGCNAENSPSLFRNKSNQNFLYVLMPIRVS